MKDEAQIWLDYAEENLESAKVSAPLKKTHDILDLKITLDDLNISLDLTEDECDFLNSIYLPSKYPVGSALPDHDPGIEICNEANRHR